MPQPEAPKRPLAHLHWGESVPFGARLGGCTPLGRIRPRGTRCREVLLQSGDAASDLIEQAAEYLQ